jgi:hypothetical protein
MDLPKPPAVPQPLPPPGPTPAPAKPSPAPASVLVLPGGTVTITESAANLFGPLGLSRQMYLHGGVPVELVTIGGQEFLQVVTPEALRSRAENVGMVCAWRATPDGGLVLKPVKMPRDDANALLATREARSLLPPISLVVRCPVVVAKPDKKVAILGKGYHEALGGLLVTEDVPVETLDLKIARKLVMALVDEFLFQSAGDKSRSYAGLITPALRMGGFLGRKYPIHVYEADHSLAGKGFQTEMVALIYNESPNLVTCKKGGVGSFDESFSSALIAGRPFICLDNLRGRLDTQNLEAFLTAPGLFPARVPGRGEIHVDPKRFTLQLTSNGFETTRDLANRANIIRIHKREHHEFRDILGEIATNRGKYLSAIFTLVAAWHGEGQPRTKDTRHGFRDWAQSLDWIVQNLLGGAPLMDGHEEAQARTCDPAKTWLRQVCILLEARAKMGCPVMASEIVDLCSVDGIQVPGSKPDNNDDATTRIAGRVLGRLFGHNPTIECEGYRITRETQDRVRPGEGGPYQIKSYTVTKL